MTPDKSFESARETSWKNLGRRITFFLPGMFRLGATKGQYPGISITGNRCRLCCDHCGGKILEAMISADKPHELVEKCIQLEKKGHLGVLLSGGCAEDGKLPWKDFVPAIANIKRRTNLFISIHSGLVDMEEARDLKRAGVEQALIDVIGDDETYKKVYHVPFGVTEIENSMAALEKAGLPIVPHVVCGLNHGRMAGEEKALEMISRFSVEQVVIVSLMNLRGTIMEKTTPPDALSVARLIAKARAMMPETPLSLGCARQRGNPHLETLAIDAGINRMALPSEEALVRAKHYSLDIRYQKTCCSVPEDHWGESWHEFIDDIPDNQK